MIGAYWNRNIPIRFFKERLYIGILYSYKCIGWRSFPLCLFSTYISSFVRCAVIVSIFIFDIFHFIARASLGSRDRPFLSRKIDIIFGFVTAVTWYCSLFFVISNSVSQTTDEKKTATTDGEEGEIIVMLDVVSCSFCF